MGGYVERYEGDFDFLTIRGAGHMVPTYKPQASFVFLQSWITNTDYPAFDSNCTAPPLSPIGSVAQHQSDEQTSNITQAQSVISTLSKFWQSLGRVY